MSQGQGHQHYTRVPSGSMSGASVSMSPTKRDMPMQRGMSQQSTEMVSHFPIFAQKAVRSGLYICCERLVLSLPSRLLDV
jgi:hypothetical protein